VPFALAAGLSGAVTSSGIIMTAGLAEIAAGSIAMGLGGYLAAKSDAEHYDSERRREEAEILEKPDDERQEVSEILVSYGLAAAEAEAEALVDSLAERPRSWVDFMMRFELGLEQPDRRRARTSALTIAGSYIAGGLVPLLPYALVLSTSTALIISVIVTLAALLIFGFIKGRFTGTHAVRSGLQTMTIGGLAAAAAFGIARIIGHA